MDIIQGGNREVTQAIARTLLNDWKAAGVLYRSKYDNQICAALFEDRFRLIPRGDAVPLTQPLPEFEQVCREFNLSLESEP